MDIHYLIFSQFELFAGLYALYLLLHCTLLTHMIIIIDYMDLYFISIYLVE